MFLLHLPFPSKVAAVFFVCSELKGVDTTLYRVTERDDESNHSNQHGDGEALLCTVRSSSAYELALGCYLCIT